LIYGGGLKILRSNRISRGGVELAPYDGADDEEWETRGKEDAVMQENQ
jgi:hypothetical protein